MKLHTEIQGNGPALVLIHGWGLNGAVWADVAERLASRFRVVAVDLPGHGHSPMPAGAYTLAQLAAAVNEAAGPEADWIGWSLGGLVALEAAANGWARRLVLVGSTPAFVQRPGWPHAMDPELLDQFARSLVEDYEATLLRFLALQARGSERAREELRLLRERVFSHGRPDPAALAAGLTLLRDCDLRGRLPEVHCPVGLIHGEGDRLAPPAAAGAVAHALPDARLALIDGAGHAPFLSHREQFIEQLLEFLP